MIGPEFSIFLLIGYALQVRKAFWNARHVVFIVIFPHSSCDSSHLLDIGEDLKVHLDHDQRAPSDLDHLLLTKL